MDNDILDDLFHACALRAFVEQSLIEQGWPDANATRRLAFLLYEQALAERHRAKLDAPSSV